ncbi:hypothetical protein [Ilumatobacter sp.]|uniref:hypothetical protein n=1 Tax=Ilumatobacter sp. TaxID=1967498 RepID=UPI003B518234
MVGSTVRVAPDVGVTVVDPSIALVDGEIVLSWSRRASSATVETAASIRSERDRQRRAAGAPGRVRQGRERIPTAIAASTAERRLLDAIATRDPRAVLASVGGGGASDGGGDDLASVARLVASLLASGPHDRRAGADESDGGDERGGRRRVDDDADRDGGGAHGGDGGDDDRRRRVDDLTDGAVAFARDHLVVRVLLSLAPGVLARSGLRPEAPGVLRAELREAAGDLLGAAEELEPLERWSHVALRLAAVRRRLGDHDDVVELTEGVGAIDDTTALLAIERGVALTGLARDADAAAAFRDALRLPRTAEAIRRRAVLERAAASHRRGHGGRALADLDRLRRDGAEIDGLATVVRSLRRSRR